MERTGEPETELEGLIWLSRPHPAMAPGLKKTLSETGARVYEGEKPPPGEAPSWVVLCPRDRGDVASEIGRLRALAEDAPVLVVGSVRETQVAREALKAGASGFVKADAPPGHFLQALPLVSGGEIVISREIIVDLLGEDLFSRMPKRLGSPIIKRSCNGRHRAPSR